VPNVKGRKVFVCDIKACVTQGLKPGERIWFLHSNVKPLLKLVQLILHTKLEPIAKRNRAKFICSHCQSELQIRQIKPV